MTGANPARAKAGGWAPSGRSLCRWCRNETPPRRRTFCSDACVHEWKLRTDPGYLREQVFKRDGGVCAGCGVNTVQLRNDMRRLDYAARRKFLREWGISEKSRRSLWDADHIIPVAEGGGQCDLANMRTLCLKCHRAVTAVLRERLKAGNRFGLTATLPAGACDRK
ncbi:MAG TPA: HNH endonuclease signature motif containing protein [Bryobacteraceae bacterium]|jgi:5-methylcytosine-specific restriction endonuclease McrA|nr:HNH endonuclease signature motif containing protein [Bryobacteraceae bacterium]